MCQSNEILFVIRLVLRVQLKYDQKQLCKHKKKPREQQQNYCYSKTENDYISRLGNTL